jgi:two-component system, response regulator
LNDKKILLVEDNPDDTILTKRMFAKSKIANEIVVVEDGEKVINYLFDDKGNARYGVNDLPLVILLDLHLPKVDGIEILRKIRSNEITKLIPVILFSSSSEEDDLITSYLLGVIAFIRKPVKFIDFAEAVRELGLYILVTQKKPLEFITKR